MYICVSFFCYWFNLFLMYNLCMLFSPLDQFNVFVMYDLFFFGLDFSITNMSMFLIIMFFFYTLSFFFVMKNASFIPNMFQVLFENILTFIYSLVKINFTYLLSNILFPYLYTLFLVVLFSNLFGMIPYSFTVTSHLMVTFGLSLIIFIFFVSLAMYLHGESFLGFFFPSGAPLLLAPLLVVMELISYVLSVFSLSISLFANMMSGHTLLKVLVGFAWMMMCSSGFLFFFSMLPLMMLFLLTGLELAVALLQSYVFVVLSVIYMEESFAGSH